ncbi:MAG: hypothetical protein GTN89_09920 [Acidobacteria bacterium]|nr:hypothetical protein [Acidobacteriota bacterium]NIQ30671.1 hypothetical protein [Acidobacteriota bacterium]NIQ85629.1 hypothetical protein [Acidobacteriota bacterium]
MPRILLAVAFLTFGVMAETFGSVPVRGENRAPGAGAAESREVRLLLERVESIRFIVPGKLVAQMWRSRSGPDANLLSETDPAACTDETPTDTLSPGRQEQLAVFGGISSTFQPPAITPIWDYRDVLGLETDVTDFRPSRWFRSLIDPTWRYEDEPALEGDEIEFNPARWFRSSIDMWWCPSNDWP